jgi:hypothetical protein
MSPLGRVLFSAVGLSLCLGFAPTNSADGFAPDDDDDRKKRGHRGHDHDRDDDDDDDDRRRRRHHGSRYGHKDWTHVVPHHQRHNGAYFSIGKLRFYTAAPVVPVAPVAVGRPAPPPVQVQKPIELKFGGFQRHDDLGRRLEYHANAMCLDMHYNYRHYRNFAHVYREAYDILQAAKFIHAKEHQGDHQAIRDRMIAVDRLLHHVQEQAEGWTQSAGRQVGNDSLQDKIASVEAVVHHLCYEVGVEPHHQGAPAPRQINPDEAAPPPAG